MAYRNSHQLENDMGDVININHLLDERKLADSYMRIAEALVKTHLAVDEVESLLKSEDKLRDFFQC